MLRVIAEIGLNHNGSEERAWNLFSEITKADVDGITFQIRENEFYDKSHPRKVELSKQFYEKLISVGREFDKEMGVAICDVEKVHVFDEMGVTFWKTLSWDIANAKLQTSLQKTDKTVYVSTGISSMEDIVDAGRLYKNIVFIHTQLNYKLDEVNLSAIEAIKKATEKPVAYGLHSKECEVLYMASVFLPEAIFFYVKDDTVGEHPDDEHAISLTNLEALTSRLKRLAQCVGKGDKYSQENALLPSDDPLVIRIPASQ